MDAASVAGLVVLCTVAPTLVSWLVGCGLRRLNRRRGWCGLRTRAVQTLLIGFISFLLVYLLFARSWAASIYVPFMDSSCLWPRVPLNCGEIKHTTVNETWLRLMIPPPVRNECYSDDEWVCRCADIAFARGLNGDWTAAGVYLFGASLSYVTAIIAGAVIWRCTRPAKL